MSKTNRTPVGGLKKSKKAKGSKKGRKIGRDKVKCERYRLEGRREKNKARRAAKRLKARNLRLHQTENKSDD